MGLKGLVVVVVVVWDGCSPGLLGGTSLFQEDRSIRPMGDSRPESPDPPKVHRTSVLTDVERILSGTLGRNTCAPQRAEYPANWVIPGRSLRPTQSSPHTHVYWCGTELARRFGTELLFSAKWQRFRSCPGRSLRPNPNPTLPSKSQQVMQYL